MRIVLTWRIDDWCELAARRIFSDNTMKLLWFLRCIDNHFGAILYIFTVFL